MKMRGALMAVGLALLLSGCQAAEAEETESLPPDTSVPMEESAPPVEPEPFPDEDLLEQLLAQQPIDDEHDAFLVPTGGKLGTLLVMAEKGEQDLESWFAGVETTLSVWDPRDMDAPIQTMTVPVEDMVFGHHEVVDANFDGHMDFSCQWFLGNQPAYSYFWIWDEGTGQFVEEPAFREISCPRINPETEVIDGWARNSGGGDGLTTFHRWEDGRLVCVRRIETGYDDANVVTTNEASYFPSWIRVEDRIDGELTQVYYQYFPADEGEGFFPEQFKWENLDYHGED